ncbi:MAG TPA: hypothetical protein VGE59_01070 [Patescibacteria group bacterium]
MDYTKLPTFETAQDYLSFQNQLNARMFEDGFHLLNQTECIPVLASSVILDKAATTDLIHSSKVIIGALQKVAKEYLKSTDLQNYVKIDPLELHLLTSTEQPYGFGVTRLDSFLTDDGYKFVEINTDYPDGLTLFTQFVKTFDAFMEPYDSAYLKSDVNNLELLYSNLITLYQKNGGTHHNPTIACVGPLDRLWATEYNAHVEFLRSKGHKVFHVEPTELVFEDGELRYQNHKIDIVRRLCETRYFTKQPEACRAIFEAYKQKTAVFMNSFHDRLLGVKGLFAVLTNSRYAHLFTSEEKEVIKRTIPVTKVVSTIDLHPDEITNICQNKDNYVLKPSDLSEGEKIFVGCETDQHIWDEALSSALDQSDGRWIIQELIRIPKRESLIVENGELKTESLYFDVCLHFFMDKNGDIATGTPFSRSSRSMILNVTKGGGANEVKLTYS